jgi:hypothetical protein
MWVGIVWDRSNGRISRAFLLPNLLVVHLWNGELGMVELWGERAAGAYGLGLYSCYWLLSY